MVGKLPSGKVDVWGKYGWQLSSGKCKLAKWRLGIGTPGKGRLGNIRLGQVDWKIGVMGNG